MGMIVSGVVGALLAVGAGFGLVSAVGGGSPAPVDQPYVVYGQTS